MNTRRSGFFFVAAFVAVLVVSPACRRAPPRGLARVVQTAPSAPEVGPEELRGGIRVVFDRPVAPPGAVGRPLAAPGLKIAPALEGETRWLDDHTLVFFSAPGARGKLRSSTSYSLSLAPELRTAPDVAVADWKGAAFVYQRIAIDEVSFTGSPRFQPRLPVAAVRASLPVRADQAVGACAFFERRADGSVGGRTSAARARAAVAAADDAGPAGDGATRVVRLQPAEPLRVGAEYLLRCGTGFKPAEGNEGLARDHDTSLATYGAPGVKRFAPAGNDISADGVKVEIEFATPMNAADVRRRVTLIDDEGQPRPLELAGNGVLTTFAWSGDLQPGSEYEIVVAAGLEDAFGQALGGERRHRFKVGDASPRLQMERGIFVVERASGRYPIWTRNLPGFHLRCAAVPEARLTAVLTGPANYDAWFSAGGEDQVKYGELKLTPRERDVKTEGVRNRWFDAGVAMGPTCGGGATGVYLLEVEAAGIDKPETPWARQRRSLVTVTDLGLLAKVGNASSLVWVVRLSTGKPVAGAQVKIRDLTGKVRFAGKSNGDGVALAPGASKLLGLKPRGASPSSAEAAGEGDEAEGEEWDDYRARRVIVTARAGDDLAALDTNWNNGIQVWNFGVDADRRGGETRVRGFLHSDRGLYRPGETVHLHGLVRAIDVAGRMAVPRGRTVHVTVTDPHRTAVLDEELAVSAFGGFARDLALATEARLGDWRVTGEIDGQKFSERFSVEEFRPRAFEVKVKTPRKDLYLGQRLRFEVAASFLYGSPLRAGKVTWNVRRRERVPRFAGFTDYVFQDFAALADSGRFWARDEQRSFSEPVADGQGELDGAGKLAVVASDEVKGLTGPQDYLFSATVEDSSGQAVTVSEALGGHKANLYVGLHPSEFVQAVDMPFAVQLVAFDAQGKRRGAGVELTLTRRSYECGVVAAWGNCTRKDDPQPALKRAVTIAESGSAAVERVVVKEPGEYVVKVTGPDGRGGQAVTSELVYVIGKGEAFWSGDEGDRMTIVASKGSYRPGETARLVPQAQMAGALALLTLERDGILSYRVEPMATSAQAIEVKVDGRLAPNVFASIVLARGRTGEGEAGRPRFKMGMVDLVVDSSDKRLAVAVETDRPAYRPGEPVKARVKVTGADGTPVRAELTVAVADEGVLQIVGFKTPDPLPAIYASWGLGVESATTWNRILRGHNPDLMGEDGEEGGDAGGDEAGRIRSRFLATAFWAPALVTDAAGIAEVSFTAPDNLTAFRVMAVAADAGERFGSGEQRMTVSKPLQAMPALPRFLTVGDEAQAAVSIHNNTAAALEVAVSLAARGVELKGGANQSVKVAAGGSRRVVFPVVARREGQAAFTFRATGGEERDAVEVKLPVTRPAVEELVLVGEGVTSARSEHKLPPAIAERGGLEVTLDLTGLAQLEAGLRYLVGYPYGCLEQTTSKVVPMVALGELAKVVELKEVSAARAHDFVEAGLGKILRHQHEDGGFGLWPGAPPEVHYTAYALWGLEVARSGGYKVDGRAIDAGVRYLQARLGKGVAAGASAAELAGEAGNEAFALYVLAALGRPDAGRLAQLFERRQQLPVFARAFLARALHKAGRAQPAATVAAELAAMAPGGAGPVVLREGTDLNWYWSSDARTTALVLSALMEIAPGNQAIARLAEGLLSTRREGRWESTQDNIYSLLALAELGKARAAAGEVTAVVTVGKTVVRRVVKARAVARVTVPLAALAGSPVVVIESAGEVHYSARLRLERAQGAAPVADRGLVIERAYLDPTTGAPLAKLKLGQLAKVVVTVRSGERLAHVALVDRLPAGVEPVLERFNRSFSGDEDGPQRSLWWERWETAWQSQELRDDRVAMFADVLGAGTSQREYLVRATTVGTFAAPAATAEAMYRPQVNGRSASATLEVVQ